MPEADPPLAEAVEYLYCTPSPFLRERAGVRVDLHRFNPPPHPNPLPLKGERGFVLQPSLSLETDKPPAGDDQMVQKLDSQKLGRVDQTIR